MQQNLKPEAEQIIEELHLLEVLAQYGDARVVGSVALDLIVKPDIDVHVLIEDDDLQPTVDGVYHYLSGKEKAHGVHVKDYSERGGVKVGVETYSGSTSDWSIDVWITSNAKTTGFDLVQELKNKLTPEFREIILRIKREYYKHGELRDGLSTLIYDGVINHNVQTKEGFVRFIEKMKERARTSLQ